MSKEDPQLGNWVHGQRTIFKTGKMDPERKAKLNEIGFDFNPNPNRTYEKKWKLQFKKLQHYNRKYGHGELFEAVDRFTFSLYTITNTPLVSLPDLQLTCHKGIRKTDNWENGFKRSVNTSEME
jgi:hypothetical protein